MPRARSDPTRATATDAARLKALHRRAYRGTADATYVSFNGEVMLGRGAIEDTHRFLFEGPLRGSWMTSGLAQSPAP